MRHLSVFASAAHLLALSLVVAGSTVATAGAQAPAPKAATAATADQPVVVMKTSLGEIRMKLYKDKVPNTVNNFLGYVNEKFYDGTIFHRVIGGFMIQGGGFTADMTKKPTKTPIKLESQAGLPNKKYTLAMARTADPNSATSQFFINVVDNPGLDYPKPDGFGYAVFGEVISGMDVVDKIKAVKTGTKNGMNDVPETPVVIESARVATGS